MTVRDNSVAADGEAIWGTGTVHDDNAAAEARGHQGTWQGMVLQIVKNYDGVTPRIVGCLLKSLWVFL
jgi:hypothetical protein